jgi:uncharacterized protein (DUF1786 family)
MNRTEQPLAIALAEELDRFGTVTEHHMCATELRRLHAENDALRNVIDKFVSEELTFGQRYTSTGQGLIDAIARAGEVK